jgi:hypothetical protein
VKSYSDSKAGSGGGVWRIGRFPETPTRPAPHGLRTRHLLFAQPRHNWTQPAGGARPCVTRFNPGSPFDMIRRTTDRDRRPWTAVRYRERRDVELAWPDRHYGNRGASVDLCVGAGPFGRGGLYLVRHDRDQAAVDHRHALAGAGARGGTVSPRSQRRWALRRGRAVGRPASAEELSR